MSAAQRLVNTNGSWLTLNRGLRPASDADRAPASAAEAVDLVGWFQRQVPPTADQLAVWQRLAHAHRPDSECRWRCRICAVAYPCVFRATAHAALVAVEVDQEEFDPDPMVRLAARIAAAERVEQGYTAVMLPLLDDAADRVHPPSAARGARGMSTVRRRLPGAVAVPAARAGVAGGDPVRGAASAGWGRLVSAGAGTNRLVSRRSLMMAAATTAATPMIATGCAARSRTGQAMDEVTLISGPDPVWDGYPWVAATRGFFTQAGLRVSIVSGVSSAATLAALAAGRADLGVVDYAELLLRAESDAVASVHGVAAIHPRSLLGITVRPGRGITQPQDLAGVRLAQTPNAVYKRLFGAYARVAGFDPTHTTWRQAPVEQLPTLLDAGAVDGIGQCSWQAFLSSADHEPPVVLAYANVLEDLVGDVLVASETMLTDRRDVVRRFTSALLKGLRYAVDQPQQTAQILHTAHPDVSVQQALAELVLLGLSADPRMPGQGMGQFDFSRVSRSIALLQASGVYRTPVTGQQLVELGVVAR